MGKQAYEEIQHQRDCVAWLAARSGREANFTLDCAGSQREVRALRCPGDGVIFKLNAGDPRSREPHLVYRLPAVTQSADLEIFPHPAPMSIM